MNAPAPRHDPVKTIAGTVVLLAVLLLAWFIFKRVADAPGRAVAEIPVAIDQISAAAGKASDRAADSLKRLMTAINTKTIKTDYASTGTTLAGTSRLQVATIDQTELFDRTDHSEVFGVPLPDVIVSARAPVEYTYYLDLTDDWDFRLDNKHVYAIAPTIRFNKPAVDASAITYKVEQGSIIRDQQAAIDALKDTITAESYKRAQSNVQLARETARREAEKFVRKFIVETYGVDKDVPVSLAFRDEVSPEAPPPKP